MKHRTYLLIASIAALMLGLLIAQPLFNSNINRVKPPDDYVYLDLDVVYAYFSTKPVSENITGLFPNSNSHDIMGNFFVVLNVTNHSNVTLVLSTFLVTGGQEILIENNGSNGPYSSQVHLPFFQYEQTYSYEASSLYSADDMIWQPYESRLIALSGFTHFYNYPVLQNGTFYIGGCIRGGVPYGYPSFYIGGGAKLITVKNFGNEYYYNALVSENETIWVPSGLMVEILSWS